MGSRFDRTCEITEKKREKDGPKKVILKDRIEFLGRIGKFALPPLPSPGISLKLEL